MNANPLPPAEFVPATPGTPSPSPGAEEARTADPHGAADPGATPNPRAAADFAALLQSAGFAAEALAAEEATDAACAASPEGTPTTSASGSALEGLLFLAALQAPPAASPATAGTRAAPLTADTPTESGALAARSLDGSGATDATGLRRAIGPADPALADRTATGPEFAAPLAEAARRTDLEAIPQHPSLVADAAPTRGGNRAEPKYDPTTALVLAAGGDPAKRPALDAVAAESKPVAALSAEPGPSLAPSPSATSLASVAVEIDTPVHDPAWRGEVAGRIASLVTRGVERAELRLSPADLGPVEVRIDVRGGEATLAIIATQATTRDALEQALPMLRDMLAQQGLSLGQATVQDGRADNQAAGGHEAPRAGPFGDTPSETTDAIPLTLPRPGLVRRLIDVFA